MPKTSKIGPDTAKLPEKLLSWYAGHGRALPWRINGGRAPSPYHTWLSEIMLQQTTVATVINYYHRFIERWPDVTALARASEDEVLQEWAGLGYYSRARNLLKCARVLAFERGGVFPDDVRALTALPGIGDYTANAIRAIAYDLPANVVDGNVERVIARIFAYDRPINLPAGKKDLKELAAKVAPVDHAGDYAQAIMDLGATICTPRQPKCSACPWRENCLAYATGRTQSIPVMLKKARRPERRGAVFVMRDDRGAYFLRRRPSSGLLGGMWEFPSSPWDKAQVGRETDDMKKFAPAPFTLFSPARMPVIHVFTHFRLTLEIYVNHHPCDGTGLDKAGQWFLPQDLPALPTLTKKVLATAGKILGDIRQLG